MSNMDSGANWRWVRSSGAKVAIIGHRGAMGHAPENTLASFAKGLELGADIIELDVHLSKDGHLIVMHDPTVNRTTNGTGLIRDMTLSQLKALDAGSWFGTQFAGERIQTLDEVLAWAKGKTRIAVEIKNGPVYYPGIAERVVDALRQLDMVESAAAISFDHHVVKSAKELESRLVTGVLFAARPIDVVALATAANANILLPHWSYVTPDVVADAHRANLAVYTWELHELAELKHVLALGVDGIGTNFPDRLKALIV